MSSRAQQPPRQRRHSHESKLPGKSSQAKVASSRRVRAVSKDSAEWNVAEKWAPLRPLSDTSRASAAELLAHVAQDEGHGLQLLMQEAGFSLSLGSSSGDDGGRPQEKAHYWIYWIPNAIAKLPHFRNIF